MGTRSATLERSIASGGRSCHGVVAACEASAGFPPVFEEQGAAWLRAAVVLMSALGGCTSTPPVRRGFVPRIGGSSPAVRKGGGAGGEGFFRDA